MLIRLVGVRFSHLVSGVQQLDMFEDTPRMVNLYLAMDSLRKRYGFRSVMRAAGMKTYREYEVSLKRQPEMKQQGQEAVRKWFTDKRNNRHLFYP